MVQSKVALANDVLSRSQISQAKQNQQQQQQLKTYSLDLFIIALRIHHFIDRKMC